MVLVPQEMEAALSGPLPGGSGKTPKAKGEKESDTEKVKTILVIRPSAMGDIVMASPLIGALRRTFPGAHIAWLIEPHLAELLQSQAALDEVIPWPKGNWRDLLRQRRFLTLSREINQFRKSLLRKKFDLTIDVQGLLRSRILARLSGARERVGFDSKEPGRWLMTTIVSKGPESSRISSEYLHLAQMLGLQTDPFLPNLTVSMENDSSAVAELTRRGILGPFAVFCPFTTRPQKHWPESHWAALSKRIREEIGVSMIMLGGPGDKAAANRIERLSEGRIANFSGPTSLGIAMALLRRASLVVGVDTGLTHMGVAFDRPTVAVFGSTCPYTEAPGAKLVVLYDQRDCSPCRRRPTCGGGYACMKEIGVERVVDAARRLIKDKAAETCTSST
jgi:heptosyltransferase-1